MPVTDMEQAGEPKASSAFFCIRLTPKHRFNHGNEDDNPSMGEVEEKSLHRIEVEICPVRCLGTCVQVVGDAEEQRTRRD
jgi:hypothetical protein